MASIALKLHPAALAALLLVAGLAGCQKTSTSSTDAASGTTTTTTTVSATPSASAALGQAAASASAALSKFESGASAALTKAEAGASAALSKAAPAASAALGKVGEVALDSGLTVKVKSALMADPDIKSLRIDVDTKDAAVTLNGNVPNAQNAQRAVAIAKGVDGVKSVDNRLTVKAP